MFCIQSISSRYWCVVSLSKLKSIYWLFFLLCFYFVNFSSFLRVHQFHIIYVYPLVTFLHGLVMIPKVQGCFVHKTAQNSDRYTILSLICHLPLTLKFFFCPPKPTGWIRPWLLTPKPLVFGEIWRHLSERAFQELSIVFFFNFDVAVTGNEIMGIIWSYVMLFGKLGKFCPWWPLVTSILTSHKNDLSNFSRAC